MKIAGLSIFLMIVLDHMHLRFPHGFDYHAMILFRNITIVLLSICCFQQTKKTDINIRSIFAVSIVFSITSLFYYILWWIFDINTIFVFPVSLGAILILFFFTALKNYDHESDPINQKTIMICFWRPKNANTIFPSLIGSAIGSISLYFDEYLYSFKWDSDKFMVRKFYHEVIEREFIIIDSRVEPNYFVKTELKKIIDSKAAFMGCKFLRFKCVFVIRKVLAAMGPDFKPRFFEFIPALYALKILRLRYERRC